MAAALPGTFSAGRKADPVCTDPPYPVKPGNRSGTAASDNPDGHGAYGFLPWASAGFINAMAENVPICGSRAAVRTHIFYGASGDTGSGAGAGRIRKKTGAPTARTDRKPNMEPVIRWMLYQDRRNVCQTMKNKGDAVLLERGREVVDWLRGLVTLWAQTTERAAPGCPRSVSINL